MPRLIWSPASLDDLRHIGNWMGARNPAVALEVLRAIRATAARLGDYPRVGRAVTESFRVLGVRGAPYVVVYRLRDEAVEIARVRHARENWFPVEGEA